MSIAGVRELGKGDSLVEMVAEIDGVVQRAAAEGVSLRDFERGIFDRLLKMGRAATEQFLALQGDAKGVVTGLRRMATQRDLRGHPRKEIDTVCGYFESHLHRMKYDEYLAAGYPTATGVIEGACRHLVKDRMERSGMRWTLAGAQAILHLRALRQSSYWDEFQQQPTSPSTEPAALLTG